MAYDESTFRRRETDLADPIGVRDDSRFRGEPGFREEPDFRATPSYQTGNYPVTDYRDPDPAPAPVATSHRISQAALDDVFDDPEDGEVGRDRLSVHVAWEAVLLVAVGAVGYLLYRDQPDVFNAASRNQLMVYAAALGLLALGAGLTLRAGAPNLALGPAAMIAALFFAKNGSQGVLVSAGTAAGVAAIAGVVLAIAVVGFHVPGWAASLAGALGATVWIQQIHNPVRVTGGYDPTVDAVYLFGAVAALAILGGLLGTIKTIRRSVGRFRPIADPAWRRGGAAAGLTALAIVVSMIFAAIAGVLFSASGPSVTPSPGFELSGLAIGAAMLGGTSAFGRRGGVLGTLLAVLFITLFVRYDAVRGWNISIFAIAAAAVAGGLIVTRLVETFGRPVPPPTDLSMIDDDLADDRDWVSTTPSGTSDTTLTSAGSGSWASTSTGSQDAWSTSLPSQPTAGRSDAWDEDRWGSTGR